MGRGKSNKVGNAGSVLTVSFEDARKSFNSLKRPSSGSVNFSYNNLKATITKVTPGYRTASGSNLMYSVSVYNIETGENLFRTNRRGSDAWSQAKDDAKQYLGLKTEAELYPWRRRK